MLPQKMFRNYVAGDAICHILWATETRKDVSFLVIFCFVLSKFDSLG